jgi:hypothetical protein
MRQSISLKKSLIVLCFLFSLCVGICLAGGTGKVFAATQAEVTLELQEGQFQGTPLFQEKGSNGEQVLWEPGMEKGGMINLKNKCSESVQLKNVAITLQLEKLENGVYQQVKDSTLYDLYAQNMNLQIIKKQGKIFGETICEQNFYKLLYEPGSSIRPGYTLPSSVKLQIAKGDTLSLEYRVKMAEEADNRLQGLKATVDFLIKVEGKESSNGGGSIEPGSSSGKSSSHWAHNCIRVLTWRGIIPTYSNEAIREDDYLTRAEAAELMVRALELEITINDNSPYLDTLPQEQRGFILTATEKGIFKGYSGGRFLPNQHITREEMTCVLIRAFHKKLQEPFKLNFIDQEQISKWALRDVKTGVQNKVIFGYPDQSFRPQANITRAEVFAIVCRLLGLHLEHG